MATHKDGRIITFYSFKGGVGRTMALANVALLAAMNGKRVLVMDWDLEAPGLYYYFRGLLDRSLLTSLDEDPGVLNFLFEWANKLGSPLSDEEFATLKERFANGDPFDACVRKIVDPQLASSLFPSAGLIDFIGAGGKIVGPNYSYSYEETLAKFSWPSFFDQKGGGFVLDSLRKWSAKNYDLVLIDSRTGLADVAGICTMLLPDVVALCFVLNQQNIDGVSKVAASVRSNSDGAVILRAVPMKVARRESSDASDAQARALKELTRIGGFTSDDAVKDMQQLSIAMEDNVPFHETLAAFVATDPTVDPLTLNYLKLAKEVVDSTLVMPKFDPGIVSIIKRNLAPSNSTKQYVIELKTAEPTRAYSELERLIEAAVATDVGGSDLDSDYVESLFDATIDLVNRSDEPDEVLKLQGRLLELVRRLYRGDQKRWIQQLIFAIERTFEIIFLFDKENEEFELLKELDSVLSSQSDVNSVVKRMNYKRRIVRRYIEIGDMESARDEVHSVIDIGQVINLRELPEQQWPSFIATRMDTKLLSGEVDELEGKFEQAIENYNSGLEIGARWSSHEELIDISFLLHFKLTKILSDDRVILHAIESIKTESKQLLRNFLEICDSVGNLKTSFDKKLEFYTLAFGDSIPQKRFRYSTYFGRMPHRAAHFIEIVNSVGREIPAYRNASTERLFDRMILIVAQIVRGLSPRATTFGTKSVNSVLSRASKLLILADVSELPSDSVSQLEAAVASMRNILSGELR